MKTCIRNPIFYMNISGFLIITIIALFTAFFFMYAKSASAQATSYGVADSLVIKEKAQDGDIISFSSMGYVLSKTQYDPTIIGVVSLAPAIGITAEGEGMAKTYPVMSSGNIYVRVSAQNGQIKKGDLITSSTVPGVGMKADKSGFVIGIAYQDYSSNNKTDVGKIAVSLNIHYVYNKPLTPINSILDIINLSALATYEQPSLFLRYLIAAFIIIVSMFFGFLNFGRSANTGIEALGRNPLARRSIQFGIFINALITIIIVIGGVAVAYLVIKL